jgi:hypothetical protein
MALLLTRQNKKRNSRESIVGFKNALKNLENFVEDDPLNSPSPNPNLTAEKKQTFFPASQIGRLSRRMAGIAKLIPAKNQGRLLSVEDLTRSEAD